MTDAREALVRYHERSKHRPDRYAPGPGRLDWANQPDPFREFAGAPRIALPLAADGLATSFRDVRRGSLPPPRPFGLESVAILLELSLGLSAWKSYGGTRWALRCNPSSGNLHPTEGYLVCPDLAGIPAGVHHYVSRDHALEHRAAATDPRWAEAFAGRGFFVAFTSIHWREAWKYGMRAWRYCQHDCGHAIAAVAYAAAALGWQARVVHAIGDDALAALLGTDRGADFEGAEEEAADVLLWIGDGPSPVVPAVAPPSWSGRANRLSPSHVDWPDIGAIHRATAKGATPEPAPFDPAPLPPPPDPAFDLSFERIARQRRSAVDFDGVTRIDSAAFFAMLGALLPRRATPPWNALGAAPRVHPAIMVHRVDGLEPGLYLLLRDPAAREEMKRALRPECLWHKAGPEHLPLHLLIPHDLRDLARMVSCHQDIAADSCFALGMLAAFDDAREEPWRYRDLYWECGALGHALYLEAEAAGVRATGIGCFFDDEMHRLLGLRDLAWQSLYHFTVGGPVEDRRLTTLAPYPAGR